MVRKSQRRCSISVTVVAGGLDVLSCLWTVTALGRRVGDSYRECVSDVGLLHQRQRSS